MTERMRDLSTQEAAGSPAAPRELEPCDHVFRRTFLARLYHADQVASFERIGETLGELLNEAGWWGADDETPPTARNVKAVADDAQLLADYLSHLAAERFASALDRNSERLCERADEWAKRIHDLAEEMRAALAPSPAEIPPS